MTTAIRTGTAFQTIAPATAADPGDVMEQAGLLDWNVRCEPALVTLLQADGVETVPVPNKYAIVRDHPVTGRAVPMGAVRTDSYHPVQNEQMVDILRAVIDDTGATVTAAGEIQHGNRVFVEMALPDTMTVGGVDPIGRNIVVFNSHDGSSAVHVALTHMRLFCANQQAAVLAGAPSRFSIYHTKTSRVHLADVHQALGLAWKYDAEFEKEAARMIDTQLDADRFRNITARLLGADQAEQFATKGAQKGRWQRVHELTNVFLGSPTASEIRGTAWAGYQAFTEYYDHFAATPKGKDAQLTRAVRVAAGSLDQPKQNAFKAFAAV